MLHYLFEDLFLHGEGDGASAAPGNAAPGAEESGVTTPDAGEQTANRRPTKAERRAALEAKLQAERAAAQHQQNQQTAQQEEKLYTEDEVNQKIQKAVTGRVKNLKDFESELNATKEELKRVRTFWRSSLLHSTTSSQEPTARSTPPPSRSSSLGPRPRNSPSKTESPRNLPKSAFRWTSGSRNRTAN